MFKIGYFRQVSESKWNLKPFFQAETQAKMFSIESPPPGAEFGQINVPVFGGPCPGEAQRESRDPQHDGHPGRGVCLGRFSQPTGGAPAVAVDPFGSHESHQEPNSIENMLA